MNKLLAVVSVSLTVSFFPEVTIGQQAKDQKGPYIFSGRFNGALFQHDGVQKDLKLTDGQIAKIKELAEKQEADLERVGRRSQEVVAEGRRAVERLFEAQQLKRLEQLQLQAWGPRAVFYPTVAEKLKLTKHQEDMVIEAYNAGRRELAQEMFGTPKKRDKKGVDAIQQKIRALNQGGMAKILKIFTEDQRKAFRETLGEPFKGTLPVSLTGARKTKSAP